jgi:hypothetical protein
MQSEIDRSPFDSRLQLHLETKTLHFDRSTFTAYVDLN